MCSINQHSNTHQALADTAGSLGLQLALPHKNMLSHCEIRLPVGGWPKHAHRHILQLLGIYLEFSSAPLGSSGGSVRYAGEAANAPGGREEEVAESDTTTWSQWGYRRLMIKAKGVHGRQTHVCVEKTHGTARVGDFSFPKNLNWSFAVKKDAGLGFFLGGWTYTAEWIKTGKQNKVWTLNK